VKRRNSRRNGKCEEVFCGSIPCITVSGQRNLWQCHIGQNDKRMCAGCSGCKHELYTHTMKSVPKGVFCKYFGSRRIVEKEVFMYFLNFHIFSQYQYWNLPSVRTCSDVCDNMCLWDCVLTGCYCCFASHIIAYHLTGKRTFYILIADQKQLYVNSTDRCCCLREHTYTPWFVTALRNMWCYWWWAVVITMITYNTLS
jgi:hypothetical protein